MENIVKQNIKELKPYIPGKPIEEVERELGIKNVRKLASNENCLGPSPKAMAAIARKIKDINRYPDAASFYLRNALASFLGTKEDNLIIGNGSDEIIVLAARTFVGDGDEVIIAKPTFLIYEIASQIQNARIKYVPLTMDFKYDLKTMKAAVTPDTKMIFIANPDNPTGTYVTKSELGDFLNGLSQDIIVFLDEAYFEFANSCCRDYPNGLDYMNRPACPASALSQAGRPNIIVSRSFSKAYGLAGLRIGYGIADPELISYMDRVRDPFNVNLLAQAAAVAALEDKAFLKKTIVFVNKEKEYLYNVFSKLGLAYVRSATNFILVDVKTDARAVYNKLLKEGIIVRDMKSWGLDSYIRVTVGTSQENKLFAKALKTVLGLKGLGRRLRHLANTVA